MVRAGPAVSSKVRRPAKMLLDLSEEHKEHLAFLPQVDTAGKGVRGAGGGDSPGEQPARHSRPADFRCSGRRVREDRGGVPPTGIKPEDLRRRRQ